MPTKSPTMLSRIDELRLVAQCALADNRRAFGRLVEEYQDGVRRLLMNLTGDACLADDLAQETFLKAYVAIRGFKGLSGMRTWLFRIACNEFYAWARTRREERADVLPEASCRSGDEAVKVDVASALASLSERERVVATLYFVDDRKLRDIAAITGMPLGTVKSLVSRSRVKLQDFLK